MKKWLKSRSIFTKERENCLLFQMGHSFSGIYCYEFPLPRGTIHCLSMQSYVMGNFAATFLDDADLDEISKRTPLGRLVRGQENQLLLVHNIIIEEITRQVFYVVLNEFKLATDLLNRQISNLYVERT